MGRIQRKSLPRKCPTGSNVPTTTNIPLYDEEPCPDIYSKTSSMPLPIPTEKGTTRNSFTPKEVDIEKYKFAACAREEHGNEIYSVCFGDNCPGYERFFVAAGTNRVGDQSLAFFYLMQY